MGRNRFQKPTPRIVGNWWVIDYREDTFIDGRWIRTQKRRKLVEKTAKVKDAERERDAFLAPMNHNLLPISSMTPFSEFITQIYRPTKMKLFQKSTRSRSEGIIKNYLEKAFGHLRLRDVDQHKVQKFASSLVDTELSRDSRDKILDVLSSILSTAKKFGFLAINTAEGVELGQARRAPRTKPYITPDQFAALIDSIAEPYATMVYVAVYTGLRVSELIALKWRNVGEDSITIDERCCRGDVGVPKSAASNATIGVNQEVIARLERLKDVKVELRAGRAVRQIKAVKKSGPDDLVFQPLMRGKFMRDNNILTRHIKPAARKLNLGFVNWLCLRRSHAVWLKLAGADVKDAQAQMRHSRASTTLDIYQQFVPESQRRAVDKLSKLGSRMIQ